MVTLELQTPFVLAMLLQWLSPPLKAADYLRHSSALS